MIARRGTWRTASAIAAVVAVCVGCDAGRRDHPAVGRAVGPLPIVPLGGDGPAPALRGKVTLLNFWATWCPPCRKELPGLDRIATELADEPRFQLLAVNIDSGSDDAARIREFLAAQDITFAPWVIADPVGHDVLATTLGLESIPASFLVGPDGRIRRAWVGFRAGDEADMAREIVALLGESPVPPVPDS